MKHPKEASKSDRKKTSVKFTSGSTLSEEEFQEGIKTAEEGPYYTVQESMNHFEEWLKEKQKK